MSSLKTFPGTKAAVQVTTFPIYRSCTYSAGGTQGPWNGHPQVGALICFSFNTHSIFPKVSIISSDLDWGTANQVVLFPEQSICSLPESVSLCWHFFFIWHSTKHISTCSALHSSVMLNLNFPLESLGGRKQYTAALIPFLFIFDLCIIQCSVKFTQCVSCKISNLFWYQI